MNKTRIVEKSSRKILNFKKYANEFTSTLLKNIAREIVHEAWERFNVTCDYDLSLWMVKLFGISPGGYIRVKSSYEQADIDNSIEKCLEVISGKDGRARAGGTLGTKQFFSSEMIALLLQP